MKKELPKMYHRSIDKNIENVQNIYSSFYNNNNKEENKYNNYNIEKKINDVFNSSKFVYKADVTIVTENEISKKRIVAKKDGYLITINNEKIPILSIKDIY